MIEKRLSMIIQKHVISDVESDGSTSSESNNFSDDVGSDDIQFDSLGNIIYTQSFVYSF